MVRRVRPWLTVIILLSFVGYIAYHNVVPRPGLPHIPTRGIMLYGYGIPVDYQSCGFHTGQDWFAPVGTPVYAVEDGTVVWVGPLWLSGVGVGRGENSIILFHEAGGYYTIYGHNERALVAVGDDVERGQQIAEIGDEGYAPSPHLHLEKVVTPFTGDWTNPFIGCDSYVNPGDEWSPF